MVVKNSRSRMGANTSATRKKIPAIALAVCTWIWALVVTMTVFYHASSSPDFGDKNALLLQQQKQEMMLKDGHHEKLEAKLESAQRRVQELEQAVQRQQFQSEDPAQSAPEATSQSRVLNSINPVCRALPQPIPHPAALWTNYLAEIHKASQIPNDHRFYFHDFTAQLLHLVSPRLPHSVKTVPRDIPSGQWTKLEEILQLAHRRYDYVTNPQAWQGRTPPRPVRVLIMGGSLLVGMNCRKLVKDLGFQLLLPLADCSWANRLEKLLNQFLLGKTLRQRDIKQELVVEVNKVAMGGTNTETGTAILEYDLMPTDAKNSDIIINAYATNDMHILTMNEAQAGNTTLRDKVFDMVQGFVRRVMTPGTATLDRQDACGTQEHPSSSRLPPLFVHLDDYLGNEQREIWATTELSQGVQVLANYYGFASASYADVVRDFVYGDTREYWFSPQGWYEDNAADSDSKMTREIHPNMGMHIVAAWVMGYNFLNMITTFCSLEAFNLHSLSSSKKSKNRMDYNVTHFAPHQLPELNGRFWPPGKPRGPPGGLPPLLDQSLALDQVTKLWKDADNEQQQRRQQEHLPHSVLDCDDTSGQLQSEYVRCPFSWLSGISSEQTKASVAEAFFKDHMSFQGDWSFVNDHGKLGIVPFGTMSGLTMELNHVSQPIRKITIFYMKSYGEKWARSETRVQVMWQQEKNSVHTAHDSTTTKTNWEQLDQRSILGFHSKQTSETYSEIFDLSKAPIDAGASLKVKFVLIEGTTFKIMGVAFCS